MADKLLTCHAIKSRVIYYFTYPSLILCSLIQTLQALVCTSSSFPCTISISDWLMASHSYKRIFETWKIPGHLASWTEFLAHWGRTL